MRSCSCGACPGGCVADAPRPIPPAVAEFTVAERQVLIARIAALSAELDACCSALPGTTYMDPPDGGDVPVSEQLRRMGEDAARFRKLLRWMSSNVKEGWDEVQRLAGVATYVDWEEARAYLDALPECNVGLSAAPVAPQPGRPMYCAVRGVLRGLNGVGVCGSVINAELCGSTGDCKHQRAAKP